jgi:carboxyl-terminal processing protease
MSPRAAFLSGLCLGLMAAAVVLLLLGLGLGPGARPQAIVAEAAPRTVPPASSLDEVLARLHADYVDTVDVDALAVRAAQGVVQEVDRFSRYLDAAAYRQMQAEARGDYVGIGVELRNSRQGLIVSRVIPGSPAMRAGVRAGDRLLQIDALQAEGASLETAAQALQGPAGSSLTLRVVRAGVAAPLSLRLQRADIQVRTVSATRLSPAVAHVHIARFNAQTPGELVAALRRLANEDPTPLRRMVLDLRGNPGGLLASAVEVADDLLPGGLIVTASGRRSDAAYRAEARPGELLEGTRIAVLANGGTASAAEILAAALRDNARAALLGRTTYGKGSVQSLLPLSRGDALLLTTARYFTPRGVSLHGQGLQPDGVIEAAAADPDPALPAGKDAAVIAALAWLDRTSPTPP